MAEATSAKKKSKKSAGDQEIVALGEEYGVETNLPFSTPFNPGSTGLEKKDSEKTLHEISRYGDEDMGPTVRQLVTMRRMDGQARALYRLLTLPIRAALTACTFIPGEDGEEEAEFIENVFRLPAESGGMTVTFHRFMSQILMGLFDGFAVFEKVFHIPESGPLQGKITLRKMGVRPPETVTFVADDKGGFAGFRQQASQNGKAIDVYVPADYTFYYAAQEEERKFYGVSFFQSAFYHYDKKVKLYYTAHLAAQRTAVGTRIGTVPAQASKGAKAEFAQSLARLSLAQWMMTPEGFKVESLREGGNFDFLNLINHHNSQMSKSVLANFFDSTQGGGSNDTSLVNFAQPGDEMFILMLRAIMDDIANQINHYIVPQLIDLNFKDGVYPTFTWGTLTDEQKAAISATFDKVLVAGESVNATPEFVRALEEQVASEMGLEIDYDEVEAREAEEAATQEASGIDPLTGQPIPGGPADPAAQGAVDPATGLPMGGEAPPPAEGAAASWEEQGVPLSQADLGLDDDFTLEEFEAALVEKQAANGVAPMPSAPPEEDSGNVALTSPSDDLLALAQEMLNLAQMEDARA